MGHHTDASQLSTIDQDSKDYDIEEQNILILAA